VSRDSDTSNDGPPFEDDPEGLWKLALPGADRAALAGAFARDDELREPVEDLLRGLPARLRGVFVLAFAAELRRSPAQSPAAAYLPALGATIAATKHGPAAR